MAKCPNCNYELVQDNDNLFSCPNCGGRYKINENISPNPSLSVSKDMELEQLKARIMALEAEQQQPSQPEQRYVKRKTNVSLNAKASPVIKFIKKYWIVMCVSLLAFIIALTLMICFIGIRGIYVNINNSNEFFSFTATSYEYHHGIFEMSGEELVDKGTWKKFGKKLLLTYDDAGFGEIAKENIIIKNEANKVLTIEDEFGIEKTFKRVNILNYSDVTKKVTVKFDPNGGQIVNKNETSSSSNPEYFTIKIGNKVKFEKTAKNSEGIIFKGWFTDPSGYNSENGVKFNSDDRIWEDVTYYANWYDLNDYNLRLYNTNYTFNIKSGTLLQPILVEKFGSEYINYEWYISDGNNNGTKTSITESTQYKPQFGSIITRKIKSFNNGMTEVLSIMFKGCIDFTSIHIPNTVTNIGAYAFESCKDLVTVDIPNSVTSIDTCAFKACTGLTSIEIPNSISIISRSAFTDCTALTSITLPNTLTTISYGAFANCKNLTNITYQGTKAQWKAITFDNSCFINAGNFTVHCIDGDLNKNGN